MRTEAPSPIDTSRGISRRDFLKMGAGAAGLVATLAALRALDPWHLFSDTEDIVPPDTFFSKAEGVIKDGDMMTLSPKKAWQELPQGIEENQMGYTAKILFPFQAGTEIKYTAKTFNPSEVTGSQRVPWQDANIRWPRLFLPKDARVIAPFDANLHLIPNNQNFLDGISLIRYDSNTNTTYVVSIKGLFYRAPFLQNLTTPSSKDNWERFPKVEKGTFLMAVFYEQISVGIYVDAFEGKDLSMKADLVDHKRRFLSPQFATKHDDNGVEKLIVIGNA